MTDEQIIQFFQDRDERAIVEIDKKYGRYCTHIASKILDDSSDVEECLNDTWMNVWNAIPPARPEHLRIFLASIVRNNSFSRYRNLTAQKRGGGEIATVLDELEDCIADGSDVESEFLAEELKRTINQFVRDLPVRDSNFFVRRYYYADSIKDIAAKYGVSETTVKTVLFRVRNKLKAHLMKEGYLS